MIWAVVLSFVMAFVLAFGLGANDVSNAFATSIGAKVLSWKSACIIASVAEMAGSLLLGASVTENIISTTIQKGVLTTSQTIIAMLSSIVAVGLWLVIATWLKLPVSATHAVISSLVGAGLVANAEAVCWKHLVPMTLAWLIAPLLAGILSLLVLFSIFSLILFRPDPFSSGLYSIPIIYALTVAVNISLMTYQVVFRNCVKLHHVEGCTLPIIIGICFCSIVSIVTFIVAKFFIVPWTKERVLQSSGGDVEDGAEIDNAVLAEKLFSLLQILSAMFTSFAHGSNDVSNSVGPLWGLVKAYYGIENPSSSLLLCLLAYGGVGMITGLYVWGARVIETLGTGLTTINPSRGFSIELGSALTVLLASICSLSISTTHCKVGSIVIVGVFAPKLVRYFEKDASLNKKKNTTCENNDSGQKMNWRMCLNILLSWICTIPFAGFLSALLYVGFWWLANKLNPQDILA